MKCSTRKKKKHTTINIKLPDSTTIIKVDEGIADLITTCWSIGISTENCCEGSEIDDRAYIMFSSVKEAAIFISTAGPLAWAEYMNWWDFKESEHQERIDLGYTDDRWKDQDDRFQQRQNDLICWTWEQNTIRFPLSDKTRIIEALTRNRSLVAELLGEKEAA